MNYSNRFRSIAVKINSLTNQGQNARAQRWPTEVAD